MEELFCPNCGARQTAGGRFCYRCGQSLPHTPGDVAPGGEELGAAGVASHVDWPSDETRATYTAPPAPAAGPGLTGAGVTGSRTEPGFRAATAPVPPAPRGAVPPPPDAPPAIGVFATPPRRNNWLLPAGLVLAALLAFLAWRGVQAVVGPSQPVWTPGPTVPAGTPVAGGIGTLITETPVSRARPATGTATTAPTATVPPTATATPTTVPATATWTATAAPTAAPTGAPTVPPTALPTALPPTPAPTVAATTGPITPGGGVSDPAGRLIAYVSEESGRPQINIVGADGRDRRQLTSEGSNSSPAWSPDNSAIYYVSERGDRSGIYRYDLARGREEPVALGAGLGRPQAVAGIALSARVKVDNVYRLVLGGRTIFELNRPFDYHWLPDGSQVLIDPLGDPREIYKVNLTDGSTSIVAAQRSWNASWGPRGEVLFVTNNPGVAFVFVADNNGQNARRVSPEDKWAQAPAWSPDGKWIAYVAGDGPAWNLYRMNEEGAEVARVALAANPEKSPLWEPNSARLVYESNGAGNWDVVVVDLQGQAVPVANTAANEYDPAWSN